MKLTPHLIDQASRKGIALDTIREVLAGPVTTYASFERVNGQRVARTCRIHGVEQQKWTGTASDGTSLCIPVSPCCGVAITVFVNIDETALRADQAGTTINRERVKCVIHEVKRPRREGPPRGSKCTCGK